MGAVAGADEAEQTPQGAEQTQREPERATGQVSEQAPPAAEPASQSPGFGERGRMRRRARFLRKARELAYRDLGGLVFDLHRFGQRNDQLVLAKLAALRQIDTEVRELEQALRDQRPVTVLREVGIAACPRCAAIHGSDDRFCPGCGLAFDAHADRPISTAPMSPPVQAPAASQAPATAPTPATAQLTGRMSPVTAPQAPAQRPPGSSLPPKMEPAPPAKSTAAPVAAKPASPPPAREQRNPDRAEEDEPTEILRPPATGA
jgi:hypothetical protein